MVIFSHHHRLQMDRIELYLAPLKRSKPTVRVASVGTGATKTGKIHAAHNHPTPELKRSDLGELRAAVSRLEMLVLRSINARACCVQAAYAWSDRSRAPKLVTRRLDVSARMTTNASLEHVVTPVPKPERAKGKRTRITATYIQNIAAALSKGRTMLLGITIVEPGRWTASVIHLMAVISIVGTIATIATTMADATETNQTT
jgi:hypothetical protein